MLAVFSTGIPAPLFAAGLSADIKANGSDGPVTIEAGDEWNYSWTSDEATACQLTSPSGTSGITLAGNDGPIPSNHPWYPTAGNPTTLTLNCTDGADSVSDSVVIQLADVPPPPPPAGDLAADIKANV